MTVRRTRTNRKEAPDHARQLSGWQVVASLGIIAIVIIATLVITKSPGAVTGVTVPLLVALSVWAGHSYWAGYGP